MSDVKVDPQILANIKQAELRKKQDHSKLRQQIQRAKKWKREKAEERRRAGPFNSIKGLENV